MRWGSQNFRGHGQVTDLSPQSISLNQVEQFGFHKVLILEKIIHLL